jgi:nitrate reductase gamma subunit
MVFSLLAVIVLSGIGWLVAPQAPYFFGVVLPLAAVLVFLGGFVRRIKNWGASPVPFHIPTTGGQQRSLDWIKPSRLDSPFTKAGAFGRMLLEVLLFRSLFRNTKAELKDGPRLVYWSSKWLWLFALAFHYCFLTIFIRHFRFFMDPAPFGITLLESLDGLMQVGVPRVFLTDAIIVGALLFLLLRRLIDRKLRYISLPGDYFPLFLLIGLVGSGICMRYLSKTDIAGVKVFTMSLVSFSPANPAGLAPIFFLHLLFVTTLLAYFPFSKLMHMGGVFLSPTRNQPNNSRAVRHENPWNPPKKYHSYAAYEDDFRDLMDEAGLPLEITPEQAAAAKE